MEIKYENSYIIEHDGKHWTEQEIAKHIESNGHPREGICFCLPYEQYKQARQIAINLETIFDKRARIRR